MRVYGRRNPVPGSAKPEILLRELTKLRRQFTASWNIRDDGKGKVRGLANGRNNVELLVHIDSIKLGDCY